MSRIEWLLKNIAEPNESSDFYSLYNDFCAEFDEVPFESTFKRYARKAMQEYRADNEVMETVSKDSPEVILDRLNETDNKLELALKSYKVQDVETAAQLAGIDLSKWKCVRKTVRASQNNNTPWFIVEGKFELKDLNEITPEEMLENFKMLLDEHDVPQTSNPPVFTPGTEDNVALFNFYDHHIGKRIQGDVTGNGMEWTTELAKTSMLQATDYFISKVKGEVSTVVFVLGNDLLNIDNPAGTTTKGTPQHNDVDYKHLILESNDLLFSVLEKLLLHFSVEVIVVPGNHDTNLVFLTGEMIRHYFKSNESLTVDNSLAPIKYWTFGDVAIGFTHGSEQIKKKYVLPMLMLQQRPELAHCKYKEFHTGHLHQTRATQITEVTEEYGVLMRILPTLSPTCEWAAGKGFQGVQATECIVYNKDNGPIATYRYAK